MTSATRATRKAPGAYHHGDLRAALILAATTEIERDGPAAVSLAALAKSLGVSQPAPYRHFADRGALLAAVATEGFQTFSERLRASQVGDDRQADGRRMAGAYVAFGRERPGLYRLMFASRLLTDASADSDLKIAAEASFAQLVAAIEPVAERDRRALHVFAALHGAVMLALEGLLQGPAPGVTLEQLIDDIVGGASR